MGIDVRTTESYGLEEQLKSLRPRNRLSEYHQLMGDIALFPQFVAVVAGLRPGMDCWIPLRNLDGFRRFIEKQGLSLTTDCAFRELSTEERPRVVGIGTLCTTYAIGVRVEEAGAQDKVHAFVGADHETAERMRACGWYPVVIDNRVFHKPFIDHLEFGKLLGYPDCCVRFFERSNDWNRTNSYAEAYANTLAKCDYRTNCFGKNRGYSFAFHMPCRFDCPETIRFSARLEDFLRRNEPEYASACSRLLRKHVLALNEREIVLLDNACIDDGRVTYKRALNLFWTPGAILDAINRGNTLELRGRFLTVFRDSDLIDVFECRCDEFGPRVPLLFSWT